MASADPFEYLNDPDKTAAIRHGSLFTLGDMGHLDEQGYLYLCDRRSDLIISGGVNVYSAQVEAKLRHELTLCSQQHLARAERPKQIFFEDQLPRTATGKLLHRTMREKYRAVQTKGQ